MQRHRDLLPHICTLLFVGALSSAGTPEYTYTDLGVPAGADSVIGVRMNNLGHVAGWSQYYGQGEPSIRGWVWTPEDGFTVLPPPPDFFNGRSRAMDINDNGIVAGDGGYDIGLAWRYENGVYTVIGNAEGMPGAYLGGINNAGDIVGTAKDGTITTPDFAWVDLRNNGALMTVTPGGGRATDVNNSGQVCGYEDGLASPFAAYRWDAVNGLVPLGNLGLAYSFASALNDDGAVVGYAKSASGNTTRAWMYTDADGMQELPAPYQNSSTAIQINNDGHVVGMTAVSGPDLTWLWTGGDSVTLIPSLFDTVAENVNVIAVHDINDAGQILLQVFDNDIPDFRMAILTPPAQAMPGDLNADGAVDEEDRAMFCAAIGSSVGEPAYMAHADLNDDGVIDEIDLIALNEILPPCNGDVVASATIQPPGDGVTDGADLAYLLGAWGSQPSCADMVSSKTFAPPPDGVVDGADLAFLLGAWGDC